MAGILRGGIHWADLNPIRGREQGGLRPVLVLSKNEFDAASETVIAVAITSRPQNCGMPFAFELASGAGLPRRSWVKISQIRCLSIDRLGIRIGEISEFEMAKVLRCLNAIIDPEGAR